ncbi:MAG: DoxX family membrane protein [Desulfobacterales bacterium]|nr:DoxX family membrane protein [Desulfobacterales bacterium]
MMRARISSWLASPYLSLIFRLILGVIFVYAGLIKITDPPGFAHALYNYHILPAWMINPLAICLPWVEVMAGAGLLAGIMIPGGALAVSGMLAVFAVVLGISLMRGLDVACGCFSTSSLAEPITWLYLARDLILLGMGIHILLFDQGSASLARLIQTRLSKISN